MRSLKTSGGLTRGRGMTEQQRVIWLLSRPACESHQSHNLRWKAEVNKAMQEFTEVKYNTREQNKDMTRASRIMTGEILARCSNTSRREAHSLLMPA